MGSKVYQELHESLLSHPAPMIQDAITLFRKNGNIAWLSRNAQLYNAEKAKPFKVIYRTHDHLHIKYWVGHYPRDEQYMAGLDVGFDCLDGLQKIDDLGTCTTRLEQAVRTYTENNAHYYKMPENYKEPVITARNQVIYFAMGLYTRLKTNDYFHAFSDGKGSYEEKKTFCDQYFTNGAAFNENVVFTSQKQKDSRALLQAPYALILDDKEEKKQVIKLALSGRKAVENERMELLYQLLEQAEISRATVKDFSKGRGYER